jgi:hypothetical protein
MRMFNNGPLPSEFESVAYLSEHEFALPRGAAIEYLRWCQHNGVVVLGFDTWRATTPGPTALIEGCEGDASQCILLLTAQPERPGVVYNVWAGNA